MSKLQTHDDYLSTLAVVHQKALTQLRQELNKLLPDEAQECISYGIPAFRLNVLDQFEADLC